MSDATSDIFTSSLRGRPASARAGRACRFAKIRAWASSSAFSATRCDSATWRAFALSRWAHHASTLDALPQLRIQRILAMGIAAIDLAGTRTQLWGASEPLSAACWDLDSACTCRVTEQTGGASLRRMRRHHWIPARVAKKVLDWWIRDGAAPTAELGYPPGIGGPRAG